MCLPYFAKKKINREQEETLVQFQKRLDLLEVNNAQLKTTVCKMCAGTFRLSGTNGKDKCELCGSVQIINFKASELQKMNMNK